MLKYIKKNKYFCLGTICIIILCILSFYQHLEDRIQYAKDYNTIKEFCYEKKNTEHQYCKIFPKEENLKEFVEKSSPDQVYANDAISTCCNIVQNTIFNTLQYFSPLLIAIVVLGTIHDEFSSGMFENYLIKLNYKQYLKKVYKVAIRASLIIPITLIIIFLVSSIVTNFNFDYTTAAKLNISVYNDWKYSHFFLYGFMICITQFLISLFYSNIALYCCKKNRNKLVAIVMAYVMFLIVDIFIYIGIYVLILNKIMGFRGLTDYFNITGYWYFNYDSYRTYIAMIVSFFLQTISFFILYNSYKNKEQVVLSYEKQVP